MIPSAVSKTIENNSGASSTAVDVSQLSLIEPQQAQQDKIVKMVLMHDVLGRMQVILPANCLLDVDTLNTRLGRDLVALAPDDLDSLRAKYSLSSIPALPGITGLPAVVDEAVLEMDSVYLESGEQGKLIQFDQNVFSDLLADARQESFAVPIASIDLNRGDTSQDLEQIHDAIKKFTYLRIQQRLEDTLEVPPLPQTAQKIIHLRVDPEAGINDLADIVESDPSLSAQVVSWASSSFYSAPGKIKSVHDAIMRVLGFDLVMNLSMGLALGRTLQLPKEQPEGYEPYWQQSMWMATATGALINMIPREHRPGFGLAYLSGLLHNFGYLVLAHVFPPHFSLMCRYIEANPHVDSAYVEHFLLGITREQVGSKLMAVWNMPEEVIIALRHQKNGEFDGVNSDFANILYIARNLLSERGLWVGPAQPIPPELYERLQLDPEKAEEAIDELIAAKDEILKMAGMLEGE
ncbi:aminoacyl-tRNA deacylase and HDOD domain-containing protein [Alkalimarinus sediminis]|uniref:HDOD domain-containing protein n=1 Tax=Alkalimarinus sediminis TaxID=1632866 RepID=A0A9E8HIK7_9ALTE|nr:HDOD domain-containing protein [Alkalimarinus sediminis]UZW75328.1 HDOD domain-containing protein [Alkalimarinus sediminis]